MPIRCSRPTTGASSPSICTAAGAWEPVPRRRRRHPRRSGAPASPITPRRLRKRVGRAERLELVERMWTVAFADGAIGAHEARLMHLAAELLGLKPAELADVPRRLQAQRDQ